MSSQWPLIARVYLLPTAPNTHASQGRSTHPGQEGRRGVAVGAFHTRPNSYLALAGRAIRHLHVDVAASQFLEHLKETLFFGCRSLSRERSRRDSHSAGMRGGFGSFRGDRAQPEHFERSQAWPVWVWRGSKILGQKTLCRPLQGSPVTGADFEDFPIEIPDDIEKHSAPQIPEFPTGDFILPDLVHDIFHARL